MQGDNNASRKVLEKCAFLLQYKRVQNYKGEPHEVYYYLYKRLNWVKGTINGIIYFMRRWPLKMISGEASLR